jgi:hypothetical protein
VGWAARWMTLGRSLRERAHRATSSVTNAPLG